MHDSDSLKDYPQVRQLAIRSLFEIIEQSSEGTVIVDRQARIVWMNERYARRFGLADAASAIGQPCETVIPGSLMRDVVSNGRPILLDMLDTPNEPLVVMRLPIHDDQGALIGAIGFALAVGFAGLAPGGHDRGRGFAHRGQCVFVLAALPQRRRRCHGWRGRFDRHGGVQCVGGHGGAASAAGLNPPIRSGGQTLAQPAAAFGRVAQAVMQTAFAALPELPVVGHQAVAAPVRGARWVEHELRGVFGRVGHQQLQR